MKGKLVILISALVLVALPLAAACAKTPTTSPAPAPTVTVTTTVTPAPAPAVTVTAMLTATPTPVTTPSPTAKTQPIVLTLVTLNPWADEGHWGTKEFVNRVNAGSKGELTIQFRGSAEAIPVFDQPAAVKKGAVDMTMSATPFWASEMPEAMAFHLSQVSPVEERQRGFHDLMVQLHNKLGFFYLGRQGAPMGFNFFVNKKIDRPQDLKQLKMRSAKVYEALFKGLGITGVTITMEEAYTAVQQGLVDGYAITPNNVKSLSLYEVTKYSTGPTFFKWNNLVMIMNLNKWNSLPQHLRDLMLDVQKQIEPEFVAYYADYMDKMWNWLRTSGGLQQITWSDADTKWFSEILDKVTWEELAKGTGPDRAAELHKMLTK